MMALAVSLTFASGLMANEKAATAVTAPAQDFCLVVHLFDQGTKVMKLSELKKGEWASVEYNKEGNERIAQIIHLSHFRESGHMFSAEKAPKTSLNW